MPIDTPTTSINPAAEALILGMQGQPAPPGRPPRQDLMRDPDPVNPGPNLAGIVRGELEQEIAEKERMLQELMARRDSGGLPEGFDKRTSSNRSGYISGALGLGADGKATGGAGGEELSATERQELFAIGDSLSIVRDARERIEDGEFDDAIGGGAFKRGWVGTKSFFGVGDPGTEKFREMTMRIQQAISGKQMTDQERKYMQKFLPQAGDSDDTLRRKLQQAEDYLSNALERRQRVYNATGYITPDVSGAVGPATKKGPIAVSPAQAGLFEVIGQ